MRPVYLVCTLVCTLLSLLAQPALAQTVFRALLEGANEVPPVVTDSSGSCFAVLNAAETELALGCTYRGFEPVEPGPGAGAAHVHKAPVGVNGPIVFSLEPGLDTTAFGAGDGSIVFDGSIQSVWPLGADDVTDLESGNLYVNIHSADNPGGEIRGQLEPAPAPGGLTLSFSLSGDQEVPPVDTAASGDCTAMLNSTRSRMTLQCQHDLMTAPPGGHIHVSRAGGNGNIVLHFPNLGASPVDTVWGVDPPATGDGANRNRPLTPDLVDVLLDGGLYVNLHSAAFPSGELRGQMVDTPRPPPPAVPVMGGLGILATLVLLLGASYRLRRNR
jgi:hypothetical protein